MTGGMSIIQPLHPPATGQRQEIRRETTGNLRNWLRLLALHGPETPAHGATRPRSRGFHKRSRCKTRKRSRHFPVHEGGSSGTQTTTRRDRAGTSTAEVEEKGSGTDQYQYSSWPHRVTTWPPTVDGPGADEHLVGRELVFVQRINQSIEGKVIIIVRDDSYKRTRH